MKVGFILEGSTDEAFVSGLRYRWCPYMDDDDLIILSHRGTDRRSRHYPKAFLSAREKGCDVVVVLTDSNDARFTKVASQERRDIGGGNEHYVILGVAQRNIECWICADPEYIASSYGRHPSEFRLADPKSAFERALGITKYDRKKTEIETLVKNYPSLKPMLRNTSFKRFYNDIVDFAQQNGCHIPNELDR